MDKVLIIEFMFIFCCIHCFADNSIIIAKREGQISQCIEDNTTSSCTFTENDVVRMISSNTKIVNITGAGTLKLEITPSEVDKLLLIRIRNVVLNFNTIDGSQLKNMELRKSNCYEIHHDINELKITKSSYIDFLHSNIKVLNMIGSEINHFYPTSSENYLVTLSTIDNLSINTGGVINIAYSSVTSVTKTTVNGTFTIKDSYIDSITNNGFTISKGGVLSLVNVDIRIVESRGFHVIGTLDLKNVTFQNILPTSIEAYFKGIIRVDNMTANGLEGQISAKVTGNVDTFHPFKFVFAKNRINIILYSLLAGGITIIIVVLSGFYMIYKKKVKCFN